MVILDFYSSFPTSFAKDIENRNTLTLSDLYSVIECLEKFAHDRKAVCIICSVWEGFLEKKKIILGSA